MLNESEMGEFVPFDFMGLGQSLAQQEQGPKQEPQQGQEPNQVAQ
jgi:hypothetical protein